MIDAVHRYDGYVVQSTGDGIFAIFGAPFAHEDHPQRSLYAALRMQEELRRYSDKLLADGRAPLEIRVGINTGEVVVRSISTGAGNVEYTPIGHTTNLASRMQAVAPTGSIAITENTRRLVEGYFALKPRGPTRVKGVTEPVNVYEVTGLGPLRTRLQRSAGRGLTKFVGREREMDAMKHAAEQALAGHGQIVAAIAEAGAGKSRLFFEFKAKNQSGWNVLETFSVSHGKASAYFPVIDLLNSYFEISSEDDARKRRERVNGKVLTLDRSLEDTIPYLFALLGIGEGAELQRHWEDTFDRLDQYLHEVQRKDPLAQMDAQVRKRRTLDAIKRLLLRESLNQPLMIIFEDLHWIDEATQEFLNLLADSIANAKILLLVNYRPEYSHQWNSKTYYTQLRLDPLGKESADEMLTALLGDSANLAALKKLITEKTEGNPFFMEETVQVLLDESALVRDGSAVRLTRPLAELKIPPTVQGILAARIDRLPSDTKDLLQTLAVVGREFPLSLIRSVVPKSDDDLTRMLNDLQLGEFIYEQPAVGDAEYIFKHALTQEVAYNSVLIERRRQLHDRIGASLETLYASSLDDHLAELARHYSRTANADKAVRYLTLAGEQALSRSAFNEALAHTRAGLSIIPALPATAERGRREFALLTMVATAGSAIEGFGSPQATQGAGRMLELAREVGDDHLLSTALGFIHGAHLLAARHREGMEIARQMLEMAERRKRPASLADAHHLAARALFMMGRGADAVTEMNQAIALCPDGVGRHPSIAGDPLADSISWSAAATWMAGYPARALTLIESALGRVRDLNEPYSMLDVLWFALRLRIWRGEVVEAQQLCEQAEVLAEQGGFTSFIAMTRGHAGWVASMNGAHERGVTMIRSGMADWVNPMWLTEHSAHLAAACLRAGRYQDAMDALDVGREHALRTGEGHAASEIERIAGETLLLMDVKNTAEAERCMRRAVAIAAEQRTKSWELRASTSLARLLRDTNRRDEARAMLTEVYNWFTEGCDTTDLKGAKALLEELGR